MKPFLRPVTCFLSVWKFFHRNNCPQNEIHEKAYQLFLGKYGHIRSSVFPFLQQTTQTLGSWLISGPLGDASCKLTVFLGDICFSVSIQSLVLIAFNRFEAVYFSLRPQLISSKLCQFLILFTWITAILTSTSMK